MTPPSVNEPRLPNYLAVVTLASGATFLSLLDSTIANLAVSDLHQSFPTASVTSFSWVISLYAILFAAFLAPAGRLADMVGRRTLYAFGIGLFTIMSLLCAFAPNLWVLLVARALQAVGAAAMIPASLAVLLVDSPPERRATAIGIWSAAASAAAVVGPALGGVLIGVFGWRSVFLINVPIGIALLLGIRVVRASERQRVRLPDLLGTALLAIGVGLLALGVTEGPSWHWTNPLVVACLIGGLSAIGYSLLRSRRRELPAIETKLWRNRTFALANAVSLFFGATLYAWLLSATLILVNVWHYSWTEVGLAMSPGGVFSAAVAIFSGRLMRRRDPRLIVFAGAVVIVVGGLWESFALTGHSMFLGLWLPVAALSGLGMGAISTGASSAAALSVEPTRFAGATGLNTAVRQIGGALGVATVAAILPAKTASQVGPYIHVLQFCCVTAAIAGLLGLGLSLHTKPRSQVSPRTASVSPSNA